MVHGMRATQADPDRRLSGGSRECEWAPVPHDVETHVACGSLVTWIEAKTAKGNTYWQPVCAKCGPLDAGLSGLMVSKPCPGSLRPIR